MSKQQEHVLKYIEVLDSMLTEDLHDHDMLFACEKDLTPMEFSMKPSKDAKTGEIMKKLAILVDKCGGSMRFNNFYSEILTNSIKLVNKGEVLLDVKEDYFYCDYLIDCLKEKKLKDLNDYRANKTNYCPSVDVMDILNKRKMWNRTDRIKSSDEEISDFDSDERSTVKNTPKRIWKKSKSIYSSEDDIKILQYIIKYKAFHRVKSRLLWQEMEKKNICNGRTWQSMKERLKNIIPKIQTYHLSKLNQSCIIEGFFNPNSAGGGHHPGHHSSSESENENILPTNDNDMASSLNKTLEEHVDVNSKNSSHHLFSSSQMISDKCSDIADDGGQHCIDQVTNTENMHSNCNTSNNMTKLSTTTISDVVIQPVILSAVSEISNTTLKENEDTVSESNKKGTDSNCLYLKENVSGNIQLASDKCITNLSTLVENTSKINEGNNGKICDNILGEAKSNSNCRHKYLLKTKDVETTSTPPDGDHESEADTNKSFIDETDLEEDEVCGSFLTGIHDLVTNDNDKIKSSLNTPMKMVISNEIQENVHQFVETETCSKIIEFNVGSTDKNKNHTVVSPNLENIENDVSDPGNQHLNEVPQSISLETQVEKSCLVDKSIRLSNEHIDKNGVTLKSNSNNIMIDYDSDQTVTFNSDEISTHSESNVDIQNTSLKKCYLPRSKLLHNKHKEFDNKSENKHIDLENLGYKYTLTFHEKYGCKRKLIKLNQRSEDEDSKFSIVEDINIIKYIYKFNAIDCIHGNEMWMSMKERDINNKRTWQSLKDRFNKRIFPNIKFYENEGVSRKVIDFFYLEYKRKKPGATPIREIESSDAAEVPYNRFYSCEEKQAIVDYIVKTKRYNQIKGNILFQTMAIKMPNKKNRTWQSLQNTFKKYIMPNIKSYVQSKEVLSQFKTAWTKSRRKKINFKRPPVIDSESSDNEAPIPLGPRIRKLQRSKIGSRHIKYIEFSSDSDDSFGDNLKSNSISSESESLLSDAKEYHNVIDADKGTKYMLKRRLFTVSDELYKTTPLSEPSKSWIQNIPSKMHEDHSMSFKKNNSSKVENTCSAVVGLEFYANSIEISGASCEEKDSSPQNETLSGGRNVQKTLNPDEYAIGPSKSNTSSSKCSSSDNLHLQETGVTEKYLSPFKETVIGPSKTDKKINSECKENMHQIGNEIVISDLYKINSEFELPHTPCEVSSKGKREGVSNTHLLSGEKKTLLTQETNTCELKSPTSSVDKRKLNSSHSDVSSGREDEKKQSLVVTKPKLCLRPKPKHHITLRRNLRVKRIKKQ